MKKFGLVFMLLLGLLLCVPASGEEAPDQVVRFADGGFEMTLPADWAPLDVQEGLAYGNLEGTASISIFYIADQGDRTLADISATFSSLGHIDRFSIGSVDWIYLNEASGPSYFLVHDGRIYRFSSWASDDTLSQICLDAILSVRTFEAGRIEIPDMAISLTLPQGWISHAVDSQNVLGGPDGTLLVLQSIPSEEPLTFDAVVEQLSGSFGEMDTFENEGVEWLVAADPDSGAPLFITVHPNAILTFRPVTEQDAGMEACLDIILSVQSL